MSFIATEPHRIVRSRGRENHVHGKVLACRRLGPCRGIERKRLQNIRWVVMVLRAGIRPDFARRSHEGIRRRALRGRQEGTAVVPSREVLGLNRRRAADDEGTPQNDFGTAARAAHIPLLLFRFAPHCTGPSQPRCGVLPMSGRTPPMHHRQPSSILPKRHPITKRIWRTADLSRMHTDLPAPPFGTSTSSSYT